MKKKSLSVRKKIPKSLIKNLNHKDFLKVFNEFKSSLNNKNKYAVAVSGGPDSIALAYLSKCFSDIYNAKVYYYIVDHKLREESSAEAKKVASKLREFKINCKILVWKGKKPSSNIQSVARQNRYSLLIKECKKNKVKCLLLGHHADDKYENFILRLLRGSGLKGLVSMDKLTVNNFHNVQILRPLINIKKSDLIKISKKIVKFYVEDPSNSSNSFKRIRIRNLIQNLEVEGLDKKKLALTIKNLMDSDKTINFYVKSNIQKNTSILKNDNSYILNKNFFNQPNEIIFRSLTDIMRKVSGRYYSARGKSISNLILAINFKKFKKMTLGGCIIEKINTSFLISSEIT